LLLFLHLFTVLRVLSAVPPRRSSDLDAHWPGLDCCQLSRRRTDRIHGHPRRLELRHRLRPCHHRSTHDHGLALAAVGVNVINITTMSMVDYLPCSLSFFIPAYKGHAELPR